MFENVLLERAQGNNQQLTEHCAVWSSTRSLLIIGKRGFTSTQLSLYIYMFKQKFAVQI